jgi:hypothetical protein
MQYSVDNNGTASKNVTLRVKYSGQFLHAFVNGKEIGKILLNSDQSLG